MKPGYEVQINDFNLEASEIFIYLDIRYYLFTMTLTKPNKSDLICVKCRMKLRGKKLQITAKFLYFFL